MLAAGAGAALGLPSGAARALRRDPVAQTTNGPVAGVRDSWGIVGFRGVRYGADTRHYRFQAPRLPAPWREPQRATEYGPACPQRSDEPNQSEDCLFLNVWSPGLADGGGRPVMVYFHGGAYATGSGSSPLYDGAALAAAHDVVVVTVNHRLNAFGYGFLHPRFGAPFEVSGNVGQLDLVLALAWVRDNAFAFGGDPGRVMVFGQSGGGAKIATLMATPAADGLFHAAATMSGQQVTASGPLNAARRTDAWLAALGPHGASAEALLAAPAEALVEAQAVDDPILPFGTVYFGPVLDDVILHRHPFYPDAAPQSLHIPMIIGNTADETRAFLRGPRYEGLSWEDLPPLLAENLRVDINPHRVIAAYRSWRPERTPEDVFFAATTAGRSWRAAVIEAEERARAGAPAYVYQLDWGNPFAPHTFDIPLAFGTLAAEGSITGISSDARRVSDMLGGAFAALARTGGPNHAGLPEWRPYSLERRETLVLDLPPRMADDPRGEERRLFATVPYVQPGT